MNELHLTPDEIVDYLHGELSPERDAAVAAHLASCAACSQVREEELTLTEMLRAHVRAEEREMPATVAAAIQTAVRRAPQPGWAAWDAAFRPLLALGAAAAVALVLWAGLSVAHLGSRGAAIDAADYVDRHTTLSEVTPFADDAPIPPVFASENAPR